MTQREQVYELDRGRCVGCGQRQRLNARGLTGWSAHHVIKQQTLKRRGVKAARIRDATFAVVACQRCHERHESRFAPIPLERLPARVLRAVDSLGPWAVDLLRRYHPPVETVAPGA